MFTGIIETTATVVRIGSEGTNKHFTLAVAFAHELSIDQSMAHDGCCLTVVAVDKERGEYTVTAMQETLQKTDLGNWHVGTEVNVERSMAMNGRFDGHIVQGHVDQTARCCNVVDENGSWRFYFEYDYNELTRNITVAKGSIAINGVSLTVVDSQRGSFSVAIIPYTYHATNFHNITKGTTVNIEFDIFGKYVQRYFEEFQRQ